MKHLIYLQMTRKRRKIHTTTGGSILPLLRIYNGKNTSISIKNTPFSHLFIF